MIKKLEEKNILDIEKEVLNPIEETISLKTVGIDENIIKNFFLSEHRPGVINIEKRVVFSTTQCVWRAIILNQGNQGVEKSCSNRWYPEI